MTAVQVVLKRMNPTYSVRVVTGSVTVSGVGVFRKERVKEFARAIFVLFALCPPLPPHDTFSSPQ